MIVRKKINMHTLIDIQDIKLCSVNQKYLGNFRLSSAYRDMKLFLSSKVHSGKKLVPPYALYIYLDTYLDIDNPLKCIIDSIEKAIENDKHIIELHVFKNPIKRGKSGKLLIKIKEKVMY